MKSDSIIYVTLKKHEEVNDQLLSQFLASDAEYVMFSYDKELVDKVVSANNLNFYNIDLIQIYKMRLFSRGELGHRELRWVISDRIGKSFIARQICQIQSNSVLISPIVNRLSSLLRRRLAVRWWMKSLSDLGILIPSFIEPKKSSVLISRRFATAIRELRTEANLDFWRVCFSLARTDNFGCVRIRRNWKS